MALLKILNYEIKIFTVSCIFAQSDIRKEQTRKLLKANQPLSIQTKNKIIVLKNYNCQDFLANYILENKQNTKESVKYFFVKRDGEISGFIYYADKPFCYLLITAI